MPAAPKSVVLTPGLHDYLVSHGVPADPWAARIAERTRQLAPDWAHMQAPIEEGALLTFLVRLTRARHVIEVGTFTGYSGLCLARGLPDEGQLISCEISSEWAQVARGFWEEAGVADRIELWLGPALETLTNLADDSTFDLAFIDADKPGYIDYWEALIPRMRPGGLIVVDNVLFSGQVIDPYPSEKPAAIRAFNTHAMQDSRVDLVMLSVADGLTLARKRSPGTAGPADHPIAS
ncbi:O-methyltransferase [Streptomyces sp. TRM66268-LWL]|uniref:O-methyltransferase n=1 Tax=Streptomyces polyasparticus TaxID=2767826 RepID=A0ABR7SY84_9ACTN|nr:O-methyltransferase [Streptomyces polyasparticus]